MRHLLPQATLVIPRQELELRNRSALRRFLLTSLYTISVCVFLAFSSALAPAAEPSDPQLSLALDSEMIYEGESTVLIVSVINAQPDEDPDVSALEQDFTVESLGASTRSSINVSYENSRQNRVEIRAIDYRYRITPKKTGNLTVPCPQVKVDGSTLAANSLSLSVKEQTKTDVVLLESSITPEADVYPLVPFEVSIDVLIKEPKEKLSAADLLNFMSRETGAPQLTIPWLQSRAVAANTIADVETEQWLNSLNSRFGFAINNYKTSPFDDFGFSSFFERRSALFLPEPVAVERTDANGQKTRYAKYSFKRVMRAPNPTTLTLGPCSLKGVFIDASDIDNPKTVPVFLSTKTVTVNVKSIPEDQAPENYIGVYGKVTQKVSISSDDVAVGDGLTLTVAFQGYGSFENAQAPDLNKLFDGKGSFKVYPATERSLEDGVAFDYKLRPTQSGAQEIPAIQTSYFNVEKGQFEQNESEPVELTVRESLLPNVDDDSNLADQTDSNASADGESDRRANDKLTAQSALVKKIGLALGLLALVVLAVFSIRKFLQFYAAQVALSNKRIVEAAQRRLDGALDKMKTAPSEGIQQLRLAFILLIRKRFRQSPDALTDAEVVEFFQNELSETGGNRAFKLFKEDPQKYAENRDVLRRTLEFFQKAEEIRFGGASVVDVNFTNDVRELFDKWIHFLREQTKKLTSLSGHAEKL